MPKFVPRQRKHKVLARQKTQAHEAAADTNATEILPQDEQERAQKKAALKDELTRESQGKMSGKKKKRLDKYIVCGYMASKTRDAFLCQFALDLHREERQY